MSLETTWALTTSHRHSACCTALHYHIEPKKMSETEKLFALCWNKLTLKRERKSAGNLYKIVVAFDAPPFCSQKGIMTPDKNKKCGTGKHVAALIFIIFLILQQKLCCACQLQIHFATAKKREEDRKPLTGEQSEL